MAASSMLKGAVSTVDSSAKVGPLESRGAETGLLELRGAEAGPLESRGTETGLLELRGAEAGPHFRGSRVLPLHRHLGYATAEM